MDPLFLADQNPFATELIQASRRINERMPNLIVRRVVSLVGEGEGKRKVAILGASYKANVDDVRESPARRIRDLLDERGFYTSVYDPLARVPNTARSVEEAVEDSDAILLAVDHDAFRNIDPVRWRRSSARAYCSIATTFFRSGPGRLAVSGSTP